MVGNENFDERRSANAGAKTRAFEEQQLRITARVADELRQIRANPRAPELGSTPDESAALCTRQRGNHEGKTLLSGGTTRAQYVCRVGGVPVFVAIMKNRSQGISAVKVYFEDRDLPSARTKLEEQLGPADHTATEHGFRARVWSETTPQVDLRSYANGAATTPE